MKLEDLRNLWFCKYHLVARPGCLPVDHHNIHQARYNFLIVVGIASRTLVHLIHDRQLIIS